MTFLLAVLLAAADAATTLSGIRFHGAHESNPAAAAVFGTIGLVPGLLALQALFVIVVCMVAHLGKGGRVMAAALLTVKAAVVASNFYVLAN